MMRTVNKDDCLVSRGANPRTGLITPDWNSVTSSLDNEHAHSKRRDRPSAQWRLDGDAWVSVPPQEQLVDRTVECRRAGDHGSHHDHVDSTLSSKKPSSKGTVTALTEKNLRTFSNQSQLDEGDKAVPPNREAAGEMKIKRKPVGSPNATPISAHLTREPVRNVSHETVVHNPEAKLGLGTKHQGYPEYYSPESVGIGLSRNDATTFPQRTRNGGPFLGVPVESLENMVPQPRGFTSKVTNRDQLQQSRRMSSGPYPSHPSNQQATLGRVAQLLHASQIQHELPKRSADPIQGPSASRQPVPRAYRPDDVHLYRTEPQSRPQNLRVPGPRNGKLLHHELNPVADLQADRQCPNLSNDRNTQRMPSTTYMTTNTHIPTFSKQVVRDVPHHHDFTSSRDIHPDRAHMVIDGTEKSPETIGDCTSKGTRSERRPQLGPRVTGMLRVPKIRIEETDTAHESRSNTTGTTTVQQSQQKEIIDIERVIESPGTPPSTASSETVSPVISDQLILYEDRFGTPDTDSQDLAASSDHSACCPDCCIKFDCHGGCLGHPSPNISVAGSEVSSLVSIGVFDASFETSVKAINKVLLTPMEKDRGRLAKVRTIFGWKSGTNSPAATSSRPNTMKRTLREESLSQKLNVGLDRLDRPFVQGPREFDTKQAKAAAIRALDAGESSKENLVHPSKVSSKPKKDGIERTTKNTVDKKTVEAPTEANEGRRIISKTHEASKNGVSKPHTLPPSSSETTLVESQSEDEQQSEDEARKDPPADDQCSETMSMVDRVSIFIRCSSQMMRPKYIDFSNSTNPVLVSYAKLVVLGVKDMIVTVANTTAVIAAMILEYNKSGKLIVPAGTSMSELAGNLLRSVLYLMIASCVYALSVKVGRVVIGVLRIVLLPVRVCAWIIG